MQPHGLRFLWCCLLLFSFLSGIAQSNNRISGDFSGLSFEQFVQKVEAVSGYHFFYDTAEVANFTVSTSVKDATLQELLKRIFKNSGFHFSIDALNNVFVSKQFIIQTEIPLSFFDRSKTEEDTSGQARLFQTEPIAGKNRIKIPDENKLLEIGVKSNPTSRENAVVSGYVRDAKNGEALPGASVYADSSAIGVVTDQFGYYSISLPRGHHTLHVSSAGMKDTKRTLLLYSDGPLNIDLKDDVPSLKAVTVIAERRSNIRSAQMGVNALNIRTIKQVPAILGETDILRVVLTLPGVTSVGEASTGFNVRGGSTDQNLILLNDATIYNPSHLFGFFSAFNPDVIKGVELYKSGIPARYGGRLSSVLDVTTRDGNNKKVSGVGGIGPLTSKLTIEGPLVKEKTSFIIGGRTTYSNWLLKQLPNEAYKNSKASFYDVNLHVNHTINSKNSLYVTGYISQDNFNLNRDTVYQYGNKNISIKWKHIFTNKFYGVATAGADRYQYSIAGTSNPVNAFRLAFAVRQTYFRTDFNYAPNNKHTLSMGLGSIYFQLRPGSYVPLHASSLVVRDVLQKEQALESALYVSDQYTVTSKLLLNVGLRYSVFNYLGPRDVYQYINGLPKDENTRVDTLSYKKGTIIKSYHRPEFRFSARYTLSNQASVKMSFNTLQQYIHMLSNTMAISPTDIWKLSDPNIKPQQGYQVALGYYRNFKSNTIETSLEVYYKRLKQYLDYKSGARLIMNHHIEADVINTQGKAYGAELLVKKTSGRINGWVSYTYSRTWLKMDDSTAGEILNKGAYYPASFDKPHNVNFIGNYRFSHRYSISLNAIYSTGRPITLPVAVFNTGGAQRLYYSDRNQYRIPDYFRMDLSMNIEGNHKIKKLTHNFWTFGVYNITARQNVYSVYFVQNGGFVKGYQLSIFGTAIPFVTYNFRF